MKIYGEKGGGGGGSNYKQTPDNLRSVDTFEGVLGLCLGPIKGPVNGLNSVHVDGTAVESASGELNFEDFNVNIFDGDPLLFPQKMRLRLGTGAAPQSVGLALSNVNGSNPIWVTRTLANTGAAFIDLRFLASQLYRQTGKGIFNETATLEVQMKPTGSSTWINPTLKNGSAVPYQQGGYTVEDFAGSYSKLYLPRNYFNASGTDYRSYGSNYKITGKTSSSPAVYELRIAVPDSGDYENTQWDVRVRLKERESYDNGQSGEDNVQEKRSISWESIAAVYGSVLGEAPGWEGVASMQLYGRASDQLTGIPEVETDFYTKIVPVPSSAVFNPETREYQPGVWDGSWEYAYTNDPAWCIADLIGDSLGGVSAMAPGSYLNKWDALELSKWCSELVDDGDGGLHPRFSMNIAINEKQKAPELVRYLAGAVGALAWDNGQGEWRMKVDKPEPAVDIYTLESIVGEFRYSHTDVDTRFNDITGKFLNAEMEFRDDQVRLFDDVSQSAISKIGRKPTTIALVGCTNRQEAMRRIMMRLRTSCRETRMVSFTTNRRAKLLQPLSHILIADQSMGDSSQRTTGRVIGRSADGLTIYVRDAVRLETGVNYKLKFTEANEDYNPNPSAQPTAENWTNPTVVAEREVTNTGAQRGNVTAIHIGEALPADAPDRLVVALEADGLATIPKMYRVLSIEKDDDGELYSVSAIEVDVGKWDAVDNVDASAAVFQNMRGAADPPLISGSLLGLVSAPAAQGNNVSLQAQWGRAPDRRLGGFRVRHRVNDGNWQLDLNSTQLTDFSWANPTPGIWEVEVTSLDRSGKVGGSVTETLEITQELLDASMIRYGSGSTIEELKPDGPGATRGAPVGTEVGGREAATLIDQVDDAEAKLVQQDAWNLDIDAEVQQAKDDINDLITTYGSTASAAASADAAQIAEQAAQTHRTAAEAAQGLAEDAQAATEAAEANAVQAKTGAEAALTLAQGAETASVAARNASQAARDEAQNYATTAGGHAGAAAGSATAALASEDAAGVYASAAEASLVTATSKAEAIGLTPNAAYTNGLDGWGDPEGCVVLPSYEGKADVLKTPAGQSVSIMGPKFAYDPSRKYRGRIRLRADHATPARIYVGLRGWDANGNALTSDPGSYSYGIAANNHLNSSQGWVTYENIEPFTDTGTGSFTILPVGTVVAQPMMHLNWDSESPGSVYVDEYFYEDATAAYDAEDSADASASSAASAAISETDAGQHASAAQTSANTASTKAGEASTSAGQAATSETNAAGSASSAAADAGLAASAKTDAENAASAAAGSETNAAASATAAQQSASAANTDKLAAQTARSGAETARNEAVTAQNNAAGSASTASTQASLSAKSALASASRNYVETTNGTDGVGGWTNAQTSDLVPPHAPSGAKSLMLTSEVAREIKGWDAPNLNGRTIKVSGWVKTDLLNGAGVVRMAMRTDSAGIAGQTYPDLLAGSDWYYHESYGTFSSDITNWNPSTDYQNSGYSGALYIYDLRYEDVTESEAASAEASAAATSASLASTKADEAGQSATSATTASNTATTKASEASASAGQAATSATNAADSASSASSFSTLAASYRDQSLDNATKAGSSLVYNDRFEIIGGWFSGSSQSGEYTSGHYVDTSLGKAFSSISGTRASLVGRRIAVDPDRSYRMSAEFYCVAESQRTYFGFVAYDRYGVSLSGNNGTHTYSVVENQFPAVDQWHERTAVVQGEGTGDFNFPVGTRYIAPFAYLNYDNQAGGRTIVGSFLIDDATETEAAGASADAAATSASTATVKAGEAATSATTATNAATTATNKAGEASTSASAAAASATTANTKAGEASASAASALTSEVATQKSVAITMPQASPETTHAFARLWTGDLIANLATGALPLDGSNYWSSDSDGPFYRRTISTGTDYADFAFRKAVKIEQGRTYRCTARARFANYGSASSNEFRVYFIYLDENYNYIGSNHYTSAARSGSYTTISHEKAQSAMPANAVYLRAFYRFMATGHTGNCVSDLQYILFEDVTNKNAAAASAAAASSSATSASADAATATSAKNLAASYRDQANSSASAAAASATTASNQASAASTSATLAASYRDAAEQFSEPSLGLNRNSEFDYAGVWIGAHNYSSHSNGPGLKTNSGQGMTIFGSKFPVDTSQAYEVSIRLWALDGGAQHYIGFAAYDENENILPGNTGTHTYTAAQGSYTPSQSWVVWSGRMQGVGSDKFSFPSGTKYIAPMAYINYQAKSSGYVWVDWFRVNNVDALVKAETQATIATDQAAIATAQAAAASSSSTLAATYRDTAKAYATGGAGLNFNGQFEATGGWYTGDSLTVEHPASVYTNITRGRAIWTDDGDRRYIFGEMLPINPALAYRLRGRMFAGGAQRQYMGFVPYDQNKQRVTTGGYEYRLLNYHQLPVNTWTDVESAVITGEGGGSTQFPTGTRYIALVALMNYDRDPGRAYVSDFTIDEVTEVNQLSASVTVNSGAIASIENTAAFYETIVAASGSEPAVVRMLAGKNGSAIDLAADKVIIRNPIGGELLTVAEFSGGKARLNNALIRGLKVAPTDTSEIFHEVQLKPLIFLASDGQVVQYQNGDSYGQAPDLIEPDISNLPALAEGEQYVIKPTNVTATQFTAKVKKKVAGSVGVQTSSAGSNTGGDPQWRTNKPTSADAYDDYYEFKFSGTVPLTSSSYEDLGGGHEWFGFYQGTFQLKGKTAGGSWITLGSVIASANYRGASSPPSTRAFTQTSVVQSDADLGSGSQQFGIHPGSGSAVTAFTHVKYSTQTATTETAVSGVVPWKVYPPTPD